MSAKRKRRVLRAILGAALWAAPAALLAPASPARAALRQVPALIHFQTKISTGHYQPEDLVSKIHERGIRVAVINDHFRMKAEYGLPPFRNLLKRRVDMPSVVKFGISNYLRLVAELNDKYDDLLLLPGVEVAPAYFWTGSLWDRNLTLRNWHTHMLVLGLDDAETLAGIPHVGEENHTPRTLGNYLDLWPIALVPLGLVLARKDRASRILRQGSRGSSSRSSRNRRHRALRVAGWALLVYAGLQLADNYPFRTKAFDPYDGNPGTYPYQRTIDYVARAGGLIFWAHPEAKQERDFGPVHYYTPAYPELIAATRGYTGFACLYEGAKVVAAVGGPWDRTLLEYIEGLREAPVWTIGEADYSHYQSGTGKELGEVETVLLMETVDRDAVIGALRVGKMYARRSTVPPRSQGGRAKPWLTLRLDAFSASAGGRQAVSGETLSSAGPVEIHARVSMSSGPAQKITLTLIKNGAVHRQMEASTPALLRLIDEPPAPGARAYYRLVVKGRYPLSVFSNPIFVEGAGKAS